KRKEGSADVVNKAGQCALFGVKRAAGAWLRLQEQNRPTLTGQRCRRDQSIRTCPDDDGVCHAWNLLASEGRRVIASMALDYCSAGLSGSLMTASPRPVNRVLLVGGLFSR